MSSGPNLVCIAAKWLGQSGIRREFELQKFPVVASIKLILRKWGYRKEARELVFADVACAISVEFCPHFFESPGFVSREETEFAGSLVDKRKVFVDDGEKLMFRVCRARRTYHVCKNVH